MIKEKAKKFLKDYQNILLVDDDKNGFFLAPCYLQLGDYTEAKLQYERSFLAMFQPRSFWKGTGDTSWLVDSCVLSGRQDYFTQVWQELDEHRKIPGVGVSLLAFTSYGIMELLMPHGWNIKLSVSELLKYPKYKGTYSFGQTLQAIIDRDQAQFTSALNSVLNAHEGMVKHGALRETSEGLICMSAMSLAYAANKFNIKIEIENKFFSLNYLHFLYPNDFT